MPDTTNNVFAALTLIASPAVLTNASSVLALNTANRFGRVVDRSRIGAAELAQLAADHPHRAAKVAQIQRLRGRAKLLMRAQSVVYAGLGLFVLTALVAVIGAVLAVHHPGAYLVVAVMCLIVGAAATGALLHGCLLLVRETRLALVSLGEDADLYGVAMPPAPRG